MIAPASNCWGQKRRVSPFHTPHPILLPFPAKCAQKLCPWHHVHQRHLDSRHHHHSPRWLQQPLSTGLPRPPQCLFSTQEVTCSLSQMHHFSTQNPKWWSLSCVGWQEVNWTSLTTRPKKCAKEKQTCFRLSAFQQEELLRVEDIGNSINNQ